MRYILFALFLSGCVVEYKCKPELAGVILDAASDCNRESYWSSYNSCVYSVKQVICEPVENK